jgi:hypothetical protein
VKSRLIPALGADGAARLADAFINDLLRRLARELAPDADLSVYYDPPDAAEYFRELAARLAPQRSIEIRAQSVGDLGARLAAARADFTSESVAFIGTDAPDISLGEIEQALAHARAGRAYIQRAHDGGYTLLGLPAMAPPEVFHGIHWSAPTTAAEQIARIRESGITVIECAEAWWDIDAPADLAPLRDRLEQNPEVASETLSVLRSLTIRPIP